MKTYILTAELKVTDESIRKARIWEKRKNLRYGEDIAHLLTDCIADGEDIGHEIESTELGEYTEKNGFRQYIKKDKE